MRRMGETDVLYVADSVLVTEPNLDLIAGDRSARGDAPSIGMTRVS